MLSRVGRGELACPAAAHGQIPALFLGWTDIDDDGIPKLLDPTPYGTTATR